MEKVLTGTFDGEVLRPDEPLDLKPNTRVEFKLVAKRKKRPTKKTAEPYSFFHTAMALNLNGPRDWSTNLDDYLYGGKSLDNED